MANNIAILRFEEKLDLAKLRCFRGAIIDMVGPEATSFHNHTKKGYLYRYPTIQYKVMDGHVCLIGMGESAFSVMQLAGKFPCEILIGKQKMVFHVLDCRLVPYEPIIEDAPKLYQLSQYIALTGENFTKYHSMIALTDKITLVEQIITGNILSFLKGIGYHAADCIEVAITRFSELREKSYKQVNFNVFDVQFVSNIVLPEAIGLGKSVSVGFGVLTKLELPDRLKDITVNKLN